MTTKTGDKLNAPLSASSGKTITLRDESDEIIDDLKSQLGALRRQLNDFQRAQGIEPTPRQQFEAEQARRNDQFNANLAPRLAGHMAPPTQELKDRLEKLIGQTNDPEVRQELEKCRETAVFIFQTFREISRNHRVLTESLTLSHEKISPAELVAAIHEELAQGQMTLPVDASALSGNLSVVPHAVAALVRILSTVSREMVGQALGVRLSLEPSAAGPQLLVTLHARWNWTLGSSEVSSVVFRPGITPDRVVDWLYMEKILELQGGSLGFHREEGKAAGFQVRLPLGPEWA